MNMSIMNGRGVMFVLIAELFLWSLSLTFFGGLFFVACKLLDKEHDRKLREQGPNREFRLDISFKILCFALLAMFSVALMLGSLLGMGRVLLR